MIKRMLLFVWLLSQLSLVSTELLAACTYDQPGYVNTKAEKYALSYPPSLMDSNGCGLTSLLDTSNLFGGLNNILQTFQGSLQNIFSKNACQFVQNTLDGTNIGGSTFQINVTAPTITSTTTATDFILP